MDEEQENYSAYYVSAMKGVQIYDDDIYVRTETDVGVTVSVTCSGDPCASCGYTYAWQWGPFRGPITGCECNDDPCLFNICFCNHSITTTGSLDI